LHNQNEKPGSVDKHRVAFTPIGRLPLCAIAFAVSLHAQAAVEYAAKSAGATLENTAAGIHFGVCPLDGALVHCIHYHYPATFYVVLVAICFLFAKLLFPKRRA
jgi:hypothetical protein